MANAVEGGMRWKLLLPAIMDTTGRTAMNIRGLELPRQLEVDLAAGRSMLEPEVALLRALLTFVDGPSPRFYGLEGIVDANRLWDSETAQFYLGTRSTAYDPGDIDPMRTLIIGHAEPDSPIALDYRTDPARVIYLGDAGEESYWMELAPSYEALVAKLRSEGGVS